VLSYMTMIVSFPLKPDIQPHSYTASLFLVPITVLSISSWTRFLAPGTGYLSPDLGCSIAISATSSLSMYITHKAETFRISIPIHTHTMSNLQATANPAVNTDAVAIGFDLATGSAAFASWSESEEECWRVVGDITGGEAEDGGRCELTGDREVHRLLNRFISLR